MNPKNEMGVVVRFAQECESAGWEIVSVQSAFPDCVIRNMETKETIKVEFEFNSSSFYAHRHNAKGCDLIVCWLHDWKECVMPVWELSDPNWQASAYVNKMDEKDEKIMTLMVDVAYWKSQTKASKLNIERLESASTRRIPCTCGMDDGLHEWDCAISSMNRKHELEQA
jgi:hypothetical protein